MRAVVGDTIGTKDGRYGTVTKAAGSVLVVAQAVDPDEPCPEEVTFFQISQSDVASIV